jgi:hypothetical protein
MLNQNFIDFWYPKRTKEIMFYKNLRKISENKFHKIDWSMQDHTISRYDVLIGDEI